MYILYAEMMIKTFPEEFYVMHSSSYFFNGLGPLVRSYFRINLKTMDFTDNG
jgi:hypothetical protein